MTGKELMKICEQFLDFDFVFSIKEIDPNKSGFAAINVRTFKNLTVEDIAHDNKTVVIGSTN